MPSSVQILKQLVRKKVRSHYWGRNIVCLFCNTKPSCPQVLFYNLGLSSTLSAVTHNYHSVIIPLKEDESCVAVMTPSVWELELCTLINNVSYMYLSLCSRYCHCEWFWIQLVWNYQNFIHRRIAFKEKCNMFHQTYRWRKLSILHLLKTILW